MMKAMQPAQAIVLTTSGTGIKQASFQLPNDAILCGIDLSARCTGVSNGDTFDGVVSALDLSQSNGVIQGAGVNGTGTLAAAVYSAFKITTIQGGTTSSASQYSVNKFTPCYFRLQRGDTVYLTCAATGPAGLATAILQLSFF